MQQHVLAGKALFHKAGHAHAVSIGGVEGTVGADVQTRAGKADEGINLVLRAGEKAPGACAFVALLKGRHKGEESSFFQRAMLAGLGIVAGLKRAAHNGAGRGQGVEALQPVGGFGIDGFHAQLDAVCGKFVLGHLCAVAYLARYGRIGARRRQGQHHAGTCGGCGRNWLGFGLGGSLSHAKGHLTRGKAAKKCQQRNIACQHGK